MKYLHYLFAMLLLVACSQKKEPALFELMDDTGIDFRNDVMDGKLENSFLFRNFYNGGGVAIGDINNDGLSDVLLTSNMDENKLYLNKGDFKFQDITAGSNMRQDSMWSTGVVMVDINSDGWLDIYICNSGHMPTGNRINKLYINNRDLSFTESAAAYGLNHSAYSTQVSFFDYDLDQDLDCFIIDNSPIPVNQLGYNNRRDLPQDQWEVAEFLKGGGNHLYRNDDNYFTEVTASSGIHSSLISFGLGVSVGDLNEDGYPDIFIANDSYERDYLYINQKNGTFKDELEECISQNSYSSMGADISDINNDGYPDIFTTDMLPGDDYRLKTLGAFDNIDLYNARLNVGFYHQFMKNCLMVNDQNGHFMETANFSGVAATDWSWGALLFDMDNDGYNDIYVCNGVNRDVTNLDFMEFFASEIIQKMVLTGKKENVDEVLNEIPQTPVINSVYQNKKDLRFADARKSWGMTQPSFSNGAAYGDLDNDGDLDLVVNNENMPAFVYRNNSRQQNSHNYISIRLKGRGKNSFAIGSKIKIYKDSSVFYRELVPSRGFQSSMDYTMVIGLGKLTALDSMVIVWPDRTYSTYQEPAINKLHLLPQPLQGGSLYYHTAAPDPTMFQSVPIAMDKHREDSYIDFYDERNLPEMLSREGPRMARADVNADGLEDIYIGGARNQAGQLYLQTSAGFIKKNVPVFNQYADMEDVAVLFFDADKDGDEDLFVGAGGNNIQPNSRELQHRLYLNDGKGNFKINTRAFAANNMNISVAAAHDYDQDGDLDLFVGGRSVPYSYGSTPDSYLYRNNGDGHFTDVTLALNPQLKKAGMVTSATWVDVDGDNKKELVITGAWMTPRIFSYRQHKLQELTGTNLENLYGWWQAVAASDLNGDGHEDLVLGNIGQNFYLQPTENEPVRLWVNDFDNSGTADAFLTRTVDGKDMPVFLKREITDQFPGLKKENLRHSDYATKTVQDLFSHELTGGATQKLFNYTRSIVAINDGQGHFRVQPLDVMMQLSSINAIHCTDFNGDGNKDLLLGGNMSGFPPQFGRLDASFGHLLVNDGQATFKRVQPGSSGLHITGEIKDITEIRGKDMRYILFTRNNEPPVIFSIE